MNTKMRARTLLNAVGADASDENIEAVIEALDEAMDIGFDDCCDRDDKTPRVEGPIDMESLITEIKPSPVLDRLMEKIGSFLPKSCQFFWVDDEPACIYDA